MITERKETRNYPYIKEGRQFMFPVKYTIQFKDGDFYQVLSEHEDGGTTSVEVESECWNYFKSKYK